MKLPKFNQKGITHLLAPLLFVVIFAAVGSYVILQSRAQTPGGKASCVQGTPKVTIQNTYKWATWGSWGTPGQKLTYLLDAINYDQSCGSSSFTVNLSAPAGFTVSTPSSTVTLSSGSSGFVHLNVAVTSPASIADGDYPIKASIVRTATGATGTGFTSNYKVYSADSTAPTLYNNNPYDGLVLSSKGKGSGAVVVYSTDDHAVKMIQTYIDGSLVGTTNCDGIAYSCPSQSSWSTHGAVGAHTVMWKGYDWFGNVGTLSANFTVN